MHYRCWVWRGGIRPRVGARYVCHPASMLHGLVLWVGGRLIGLL